MNDTLTLEDPTKLPTYSHFSIVKYDGRKFVRGDVTPHLWCVYLAKKARDGDEDAIALLTAFEITVWDADGKQYWPKENET